MCMCVRAKCMWNLLSVATIIWKCFVKNVNADLNIIKNKTGKNI